MSSLLWWCIGTSGAEDFSFVHLTSSLSDAPVLSPMGIRTSNRTWSSSLDSPALRELAPYLCFETSDEVSSELAMGHRNFWCYWISLFPPCTCPKQQLFGQWIGRRWWIRRLYGELDVSTVNWTSHRWIGCLGYNLALHPWDLKNPTNMISQTC